MATEVKPVPSFNGHDGAVAPLRRSGMRFVCEGRDGDRMVAFGSLLVIANPDFPPRIVDENGVREVLPYDENAGIPTGTEPS